MNDIDATTFNERLTKCAQKTRDLVTFLRTMAEHAGADVGPPTFDDRGIGMTFWTNGRRFCRFDPKTGPDHVWALVPNADRHALSEVGSVSEREDGP